MFQKLKDAARSATAKGTALVAGALAAPAVFAQTTFDTTEVIGTITAVVTAAGVIGAAALAMHYGVRAWKWLRGAA